MGTARAALLSARALGDAHDDTARGMARRPDNAVSGNPRVLVVEDHAVSAEGLRLALSTMSYVVEASCGPTATDVLVHAQRFEPGCVLVDTHYRNGIESGVPLIGPLVAAGSQVILLTAERRRLVLAECLEAGAAGWIDRDANLDQVDEILRLVLAGQAVIGKTVRAALLDELRLDRERKARARSMLDQLTEREALVLAALSDGLTADEIAHEHVVALTTIRSQIRAVLQKLDVRSQLAAVAAVSENRHLLPSRGLEVRDRRSPTTPGSDRRCLDNSVGVTAKIA